MYDVRNKLVCFSFDVSYPQNRPVKNIKTKKCIKFYFSTLFLWNRRGSNPRPNKELISFLRV